MVGTGPNGGFSKKFTARASGVWRAEFFGNTTWWKSASERAYVRVR